MAWIEPKTDWNSEDYFNTVDYNRIVENIKHLKELADELFVALTTHSLGDKKTKISMIYAREINNIENALELINNETYGLEIGDKQTFKANGSTPLWSEFNRIESASLLLYDTLTAHKNALPRLNIILGSERGIKV